MSVNASLSPPGKFVCGEDGDSMRGKTKKIIPLKKK